MKNSKRILLAVVAVVLLCATFVTGALAFVAGEDTTPEQYTQSVVKIEDDFNDGEMETKRKELQLIGAEVMTGSGYMFHANRPEGYVDHQGDAARIETGEYGRNGADNVYTERDESKDEGNRYYNINYYKKNGEQKHFFFTLMLSSINDGLGITKGGFVLEFDINFWHPIVTKQTAGADTPDDTSDDEYTTAMDPNSWICPSVQWDVMNTTSGSGGAIGLFGFVQAKERDAQGNVIKEGDKDKLRVGYVEAFSNKTGECVQFPANYWQHVTIQYLPDGMYRVYIGKDTDTDADGKVIGRQLLVEQSYAATNNTGKDVYFASLRVGGAQNVLQGEYSIDNVLAYQATTVHNPRFFDSDNMTHSEAVKYLAGLLKSEDTSAVIKNSAYNMITKTYLPMFWDGSQFLGTADDIAKEAINDYFEFKETSYAQMLEALKEENALLYAKYVSELDNINRTIASIKDRNSKVNFIQNFLASVGGGINRGSQEFKDAEVRFNEIRLEIKRDENSQDLIKQMTAFQKSYSIYAVSAMVRRYDAATAAYKNYTEDGVFTGDDAKNLANAVQLYKDASVIIETVLKDVNSERFINLVGLYKNTTEEDWKNDDGTIRRYWYLSRSILLEPDTYNPDYQGMLEAEIAFNKVHTYFWAKMQQEHIDILSAKLDNFNKPGATYIEQKGVCTFVNNYVERNQADIDPSNTRINELIKISQGYEALLSTIMDDYQKSLVQNTEKFIHQMSVISATNGYANIMPLFEEATTLYYSMNIESDAARAAVAEYEKIRTKLTDTATDCTLFVAKVAELQAEKDKDKAFKLLSECYTYTKNLDETYEGVTAAKAVYDAKMAEHAVMVNANEEIAETTDVICSVRSLDAGLGIIKFVKSLLGI